MDQASTTPRLRTNKSSQNKRRAEQRRQALAEQMRNPGQYIYIPIPMGQRKKKRQKKILPGTGYLCTPLQEQLNIITVSEEDNVSLLMKSL